ncbi:hypothetical protein [Streptomyces jumonjinensis]|uniref:hypothetical protein n=1 Tax=Streptomyces jumonjinensis TaxID=1945 RepID=UPI00379CCAD5
MNDTPGWASPGSARSDGQNADVPRPAEPADDNGPASKWSSDQPPAAQWSAPEGRTAPGRYGPPVPPQPSPGWGGRPQGGWGQPPAAKPGVIPLRPLGVGEILEGSVSTLRAHWRTVLGITLTVSVIAQIATVLAGRYLLPEPTRISAEPGTAEALRQSVESLQTSFIGLLPTLFIGLIATLFTTAPLTVIISRSVLGRPATLADAWREARPRLAQLLGLTLLLALIAAAVGSLAVLPGLLVGDTAGLTLIALGTLAAIPVVIWLMIRFSLAPPALMLERQGVIASLRRSAKLVQGTWWRIFGIVLLTLVLTLLVTMVIAIPFVAIGFVADGTALSDMLAGRTPEFGWTYTIITSIGSVIAAAITYPVSAGVTALLYIDQRIRREALDLELARAAGVPGYGTEPPGSSLRS